MSLESLKARQADRRRIRVLASIGRGVILCSIGAFALMDPSGYAVLALPVSGIAFTGIGLIGMIGIGLSDRTPVRLVADLVQCTLAVLSGIIFVGGNTMIRLAPEEALTTAFAVLLLISGLIEILIGSFARSSKPNVPGIVCGCGIVAFAVVIFLSPNGNYGPALRFGGMLMTALGAILILGAHRLELREDRTRTREG